MKILQYPNDLLHEPSRPITNIDGQLQDDIDQMAVVMYRHAGLGLAAIQVGIKQCFFIYDVTSWDDLSVLINPKVIDSAGTVIVQGEGCLSVPNNGRDIMRSKQITVEGYDRHGKQVQIEADGLLSILFQHEIDHLNGILITDYTKVEELGGKNV